MSIQDESFPSDEIFTQIDFSFNNNTDPATHHQQQQQRYQFPNVRRQQQQQLDLKEKGKEPKAASMPNVDDVENCEELKSESVMPLTSSSAHGMNTSSLSVLSSTESTNDRPSSVLSGKTTVSEPSEFKEDRKKKSHKDASDALNKSRSCQDVHSEYTKRRYRHVQSKVGLYIAQMKIEDKKRHKMAQFKRHSSMPEALLSNQQQQQQHHEHGEQKLALGDKGILNKKTDNLNTLGICCKLERPQPHSGRKEKRYGSLDLERQKMEDDDEEFMSAGEDEISVYIANMQVPNSGTSPSTSLQRYESSGMNIDFIDKQSYAHIVQENERIQSYSDYLQARLHEKMGEITRLRRNVDYLRIELSNCKDKLQRKCSAAQSNQLSANAGAAGFSRSVLFGGNIAKAKHTKATQTDLLTPLIPMSAVTPKAQRNVRLSFDFISTPQQQAGKNATDDTNGGNKTPGMTKSGNISIALNPLNLSDVLAEQSSLDMSKQQLHQSVLRQRLNSGHQQQQQQQHGQQLDHPLVQQNVTARSFCPSSSDSAIDINMIELAPSPRLQRATNNMTGIEEVDSSELVYSSDFNEMAARSSKLKSKRRRWLMRFFMTCVCCKQMKKSFIGNPMEDQSHATQIPLLERSAQ